MGRVWNSPFCAKSEWEGFAGAKSGVSLSPITSALLGVISVYPPVTQCCGAEQDFILWLCQPGSFPAWPLHLAEEGSEHPFPSHCHTAFSAPRKAFLW